MSFDYADLARTAAELIDEAGGPAVLEQTLPYVYDPDAPAGETGGPTRHACMCVDVGTDKAFFPKELILASDSQLMMGALNVAPRVGDTIVWGGLRCRIVNLKPLAPALVVVVWIVQVRA